MTANSQLLKISDEELEFAVEKMRDADSLSQRVADLEKQVDLLSSMVALLSQAEAYSVRKHGKK